MKFSYIILSLLLLSVLATAIERRHRRHRQKLRTRDPTYVLLCDAGSSKTECMCYSITAGVYALIDTEQSKVIRLGQYYASALTGDEYVTGIDNMRKEFAKKNAGAGKECGTSEFYVLSTAGSREAINGEQAITTEKHRNDLDAALVSKLQTKFGNLFVHLEVISGRFEGFFGFQRGFEMFSNQVNENKRNNMVYYECGGMSCQVAWETNDVCKDTFWNSVKTYYKEKGKRFKKRYSVRRASRMNLKKTRAKKAKSLRLMKAARKTGGVMHAEASDGSGKFRLFSKSWLGTGAIEYGKLKHGYDETWLSWWQWLVANKKYKFLKGTKSLADVCLLDETEDANRFSNCYTATKLVLQTEVGSDDMLSDSLAYQAAGVTAQYTCDKSAKKKDPNDKKKEISYAKNTPTVVVQSKAFTSPLEDNLDKNYNWNTKGVTKVDDATTTTKGYKVSLANLKALAEDICAKKADADIYDFQSSGCIVLVHYYTMFKNVVGLGDDSQIVTSSKIAWVQVAHKWLQNNANNKADIKWPFPNVNKLEDEAYNQARL